MHGKSGDQSNAPSGLSVDRRTLLKTIAIAGAATSGGVLAPLTEARAEIWEEGDTQCRPPVQEFAPDYALDDAMLADFVKFSELLTGVKPLDHRLGSQYLERYARRPELTQFLPQLIGAYRTASSSSSSSIEAEIEKNIMQTSLRQPAEQVIYLWYVSAFYLPLAGDPAQRKWFYGSPEQYNKSLLWSVVRGHPPMTRGGPPGYWAKPPQLVAEHSRNL